MADILSVELDISDDKAEVVVGRAKQKLEDFVRYADNAQPQIKFKIPNENYIDLDKLEKRAEQTRKAFQDVAKVRIDSGQIGNLTKEIVVTSERSRQLQTDIANIRKELLNPNRKSSIAFLTAELKGAEAEAEKLQRKLQTLDASGGAGSKNPTRGGERRAAGGGRITGEQAALLEILDDFAPAGLNKPFNSVVRGALAAGDIKEAAAGIKVAGKEMLALVGISGTALAAFGAIAAVGYGIVKVTQNIREEAERRLKVEENIASAINRQILGQQEALKNLKKLREDASEGRQFSQFLSASEIDELKRRRATLEQLNKITPAVLPVIENGKVVSKPNEDFQKNSQQILALDKQIYDSQQQKQKLANDAFNQRAESYKKSQADAIEFEKKLQKEIQQNIDKGKVKAAELQKQYESVFEALSRKSTKDNPFVSLLTEADKSMRVLRENTRGLNEDLRKSFETMEQKQNALKLFETRIDNNLEVFDLRERARGFRDYSAAPQLKIDDPNKFFSDFIEAGLKQISKDSGGSNIRYNRESTFGGFSQSDARNALLNVYERDNTFGGSISRRKTFNDLTEAEKQDFFSSTQKSTINDSLSERLQKQLSIINSGAFSEDQRAIANRKLTALTSGLNPNELTNKLREDIALASEREADRREKSERDAIRIQQETLAVQKQIADNGKKLVELAEKEGLEGIKNLIEIVDKTGGAVNVLSAAPTQSDVQRSYLDDYNNQ